MVIIVLIEELSLRELVNFSLLERGHDLKDNLENTQLCEDIIVITDCNDPFEFLNRSYQLAKIIYVPPGIRDAEGFLRHFDVHMQLI